MFLKHQASLNAGETVMLKRAFKREAMNSGVRIKAYHANNVPFNSEEWKRDMLSKCQELALSGSGAEHQNGVAERSIKKIGSWARDMLLHMVLHWPERADPSSGDLH
jgi:hypothetical protein